MWKMDYKINKYGARVSLTNNKLTIENFILTVKRQTVR